MPLLIRADGHIAGFVLVNQWSALDRPLNHVMAEFSCSANIGAPASAYVRRSRCSVIMRGRWEVPVAIYNREALAFCGPIARGSSGGAVGNVQRWVGSVLCFDI